MNFLPYINSYFYLEREMDIQDDNEQDESVTETEDSDNSSFNCPDCLLILNSKTDLIDHVDTMLRTVSQRKVPNSNILTVSRTSPLHFTNSRRLNMSSRCM